MGCAGAGVAPAGSAALAVPGAATLDGDDAALAPGCDARRTIAGDAAHAVGLRRRVLTPSRPLSAGRAGRTRCKSESARVSASARVGVPSAFASSVVPRVSESLALILEKRPAQDRDKVIYISTNMRHPPGAIRPTLQRSCDADYSADRPSRVPLGRRPTSARSGAAPARRRARCACSSRTAPRSSPPASGSARQAGGARAPSSSGRSASRSRAARRSRGSLSPAAVSASTSRWRGVSRSTAANASAEDDRSRSDMLRCASCDIRGGSPRSTRSISSTISARGAPLEMYPVAPARNASITYSGHVPVRTPSPPGCPARRRIWRAAARPSVSGIRTSISTRSGRWSRTASIAPLASLASATTRTPGMLSRIATSPSRCDVVIVDDDRARRRCAHHCLPVVRSPRRAQH